MSHQDGLGKASRCKIRTISGMQVQLLMFKLDVIHQFLPRGLPLYELRDAGDYTPGEAGEEGGGGKHVLQEASIIGHLRRIRALSLDTATAVELGAGTGRLSDRLQRVTGARLRHVMVDRRDFTPHQCRDRVMRARSISVSSHQNKPCSEAESEWSGQRSPPPSIKRVVTDIGSLNLKDCIGNMSLRTTLCMSKHLCGPACDLFIRSLVETAKQVPDSVPPKTAIATCCHYLCTWESFAGREFWEALGLTEEDFTVAAACSQWSSLQEKKSGADADGENSSGAPGVPSDPFRVASLARATLEADHSPSHDKDRIPSEEFEKTFTRKEKAVLGVRLKQLLDLSRAACCKRNLGYQEVELIRYTTRSTEDRLLLLY